MENKKTIGHLNSKAWYRLLRVIFIIAFVVILLGYNAVIFSSGAKQLDQNKTNIKCIFGGNGSFSPASIGISLSASDFKDGNFDYAGFFKGFNDFTTMTILKACGNFTPVVPNADSYDEQKLREIVGEHGYMGVTNWTPEQVDAINTDFEAYQQETKGLFSGDNEKAQYLDFSYHMFDITPVFTYTQFLEFFLFGNLIILFIFELARRIFYYVVLGSIRPEK